MPYRRLMIKRLKFLDDEEWFRTVAGWILGYALPDGKLKKIGEEHFLFTNTKAIRMDNFRETSASVVNVEGQRDARDFIFKRHLYYWAMAYISPFEAGQQYDELKPAVSIVIYEDKGSAGVIEIANLSGSLAQASKGEEQLLTMIAVNAAKWRESPNEELKAYLAILYNGVYNDENKHKFAGVNTNSNSFERLNSSVRIASAKVKYEESQEEGNSEMEAFMREFFTEEQERTARRNGKIEGRIEMAKISKLYVKQKKSPNDISKEVGLSVEKVKQALAELGYDFE